MLGTTITALIVILLIVVLVAWVGALMSKNKTETHHVNRTAPPNQKSVRERLHMPEQPHSQHHSGGCCHGDGEVKKEEHEECCGSCESGGECQCKKEQTPDPKSGWSGMW